MFPELVFLGSCDWLVYLPARARVNGFEVHFSDEGDSEWFLFTDVDGRQLYALHPESVTVTSSNDVSELYERWHGVSAGADLELIGLPEWEPMLLGRCVAIGYTSHTPETSGTERRWHPFGEGSGELPQLWELNTRGFAILAGAFSVTERGIVG